MFRVGHALPQASKGEKAKARDILSAIHILHTIEHENRPLTSEERTILLRFSGFGPVALRIFPDPTTGNYKDAEWRSIGEEVKESSHAE